MLDPRWNLLWKLKGDHPKLNVHPGNFAKS